MTQRRALVVHVRMPAFDRDSGSQDVDNMVRFLLRAGWKVTFLAREGEDLVEERHARRLRSMGVATHAGFADVDRLLRSNEFDLAIVAFWELAAELLPQLRRHSPATRVVVNSVDVHFLRLARQSFGQRSDLDPAFGRQTTRELNVYNAADAVLAVSDKERDLLADFLGETRVFTLPIAESVERSRFPLAERRGMYFVGNFRHLPNREAVEHLANDVLPQLDPALLERHPLTVLGNWLDRVRLDVDPDTPGLRLVGWVPSIQPYTDRARLAAVPLLHGAGVKRKVIQAMMAGTPVVTTPVGAEGLDLVQGETALIASDASDLAAGISRLLTDDALWHGIADAGAEHAQRRHGLELVEQRFGEILEHVMATRPGVEATADATEEVAEIRQRIQGVGRPGDVVLVACGDTTELLDVGAHPCWPFPQAPDGGVGREMVDGPAAVNHLEALRTRGARYLVLPRAQFGWRRRYPELFEHLEREHQRLHHDELVAVFDLSPDPHDAPRLDPVPRARVLVLGSYAPHRTGPSPMLVQELSSSGALTVEQRWRPDGTDDPADDTADDPDDDVGADFVVHVRDDAILPAHFVDRLVATMVTLDVDRVQPTHTEGPAGGPPITERHFGVVARELDQVTPIPVLAVRAGADPTGPTVLADTVTIGLRRPVTEADAGPGCVRRIWILDDERRAVVHARPEPSVTPRISVLIATYERPDLLREALTSFAAQTLPTDEFEVVVVDDGSQDGDLDAVLAEFTDRISVTGVRIGHAGRSAAKNVAVMLARAPVVLFFDDDDRAADDYLERHLAAHAAKPADAVAVLGHTEWAPELERSALMHYITDVDRLMFAYERLGHGQELDWRGFWEGRISCKRAFLLRYGLHDQRFGYSIDIEMGWRLAPAGLRIVYDATARSFMARPIDFDAFCARTEAKGRAHALIATVHAGSEIAERLRVDDAEKVWDEHGASEPGLRRSVALLEARAATDPAALPELHEAYRRTFRLLHAKGAATTAEETRDVTQTPTPTTVHPFPNTDPELAYDATPPDRRGEPLLSVTLPVWSRTPELAAMARRTVDRIWEVARIPTEVVVVDNGSPHTDELAARVHRYPENKGVATGWNTGVRLSRAPMVVVLNSDCTVQPGWDVALYEAASHGRRVAFPYTDHCDGQGFTSPDQGGTAGWCFMLSRALYDEVGVFDEWFNPAFCEDTDYWHRAWQMGVELTPVPAARVVHARRTTASTDARVDMLLQGHRYKYGWKHGVDPDRAPPYYNREIVEYVGSYRAPRPGATPDPGRPRVFGIGLNKTGTTSLHQALRVLGYDSLHWGGPALRRFIETSLAEGAPLLSRLDPHLDAFSDIQVLSEHYELLDTQYPGSRFVLTVRPLDDWIASRRRHVETNRRRKEAGTYHGRFLEVDEPAWREHWTRHVEGAREYFAGRDDFLELDLIASPDWRPLCDLLGRPRPTIDFPWANRGDDE